MESPAFMCEQTPDFHYHKTCVSSLYSILIHRIERLLGSIRFSYTGVGIVRMLIKTEQDGADSVVQLLLQMSSRLQICNWPKLNAFTRTSGH